MNERSPLPEALATPPRGRVLLLAPHADDDVLGAGGTVAKHVAQGDTVQVVVAYDGAAGDPDGRYEPGEYLERRREEARRAGRHLGLADYHFWNYPEGHEPGAEELLGAAHKLGEHVKAFAPDLVYAPWIGDHHIDHWVLARATRLALAMLDFQGEAWGYEVWTPLVPTRIVDITGVFAAKKRALEEHASQLAYHDLSFKGLAISAQRAMYLSEEALHGEAFRPLGEPSPEDRALLEPDSSPHC